MRTTSNLVEAANCLTVITALQPQRALNESGKLLSRVRGTLLDEDC